MWLGGQNQETHQQKIAVKHIERWLMPAHIIIFAKQ